MKKRDVEVLFCFEPYDELVLLQLREFDRKQLTSVEKDMRQDSNPDQKTTDENTGIIFIEVIIVNKLCLTISIPHRINWLE